MILVSSSLFEVGFECDRNLYEWKNDGRYRYSGINEIVNDENGILVPAKNPGALAGAMNKLATDVLLRNRLAFHAKKTYEENLVIQCFWKTIEHCIEKYKEDQNEKKK